MSVIVLLSAAGSPSFHRFLDFLHSFGDLGFYVGLAEIWVSRCVWAELFSSGDGWLVDPASAESPKQTFSLFTRPFWTFPLLSILLRG